MTDSRQERNSPQHHSAAAMPPKPDKNDYNSLHEGLPRYAADQFALSTSTTAAHNGSIAYEVPQSSSGGRKAGADSLSGLRALPEVRPIPWIPGKELPPEKSTESPRTQTRGAFLLSTRGNINNPQCTHCASGSGRFAVCVSLGDWFHGACSTCQMATRGNLCSLRTGKSDDTPAINKSIELEPSRTPNLSGFGQTGSPLKRKRSPTSTAIDQNTQLPTPAFSNFIQPTQSSPSGFTPSNIPAASRFVAGNTPATNYTYQMEKSTNWSERVAPSYQAQTNLTQERMAPPSQTQNNLSAQYTAPTNSFNGARITNAVQEDQAREASTSISPSAQLLQPTQQERPPVSGESVSQNFRQSTNSSFTPLIDSLPRHKQKRIFGIIGGIQSGIRTVRQQTDTLQKQLNLLQAELGIDTEDDNGEG